MWRNWLARSAVNRKVAGSSPARCGVSFLPFKRYIETACYFYLTIFLLVPGFQARQGRCCSDPASLHSLARTWPPISYRSYHRDDGTVDQSTDEEWKQAHYCAVQVSGGNTVMAASGDCDSVSGDGCK